VLVNVADTTPSADGLSFESAETGTQVDVPVDSSEPLVLDNETTGTVAVELPFADQAVISDTRDSLAEFDNANDSRTIPIVKTDGSVQITTILESRDAPADFPYTITTGDGGYLEESGRMIIVRNADGSWAAGVAPAWAVDADGRAVPTHYEIAGNTLTQVVEHKSSSFRYPIVADPYLGQALISRVDVGSENGKPRYNVVKTAYGDNVALGSIRPGSYDPLLGATVMRGEGWKEAIAKRPAMNITTIKQQYDCHTVYAPSKNPWNLEAFRGQNANWGSNPKSCNW
jgi:hypothetical protein